MVFGALTLDWFKSYLTERTLQVKCHTDDDGTITYSKNYSIDIGTPQGSCLGPLLFIIFTNDLHRNLVYTNCILFADDTTIYYTHENLRYLQWCLEEDLKIIADWFKANQLTLNIGKSVCRQDRGKTQKLTSSLNIKIDSLSLPVVTSFKFLGIWLDKDLNWNVHVNKLITKIKQNLHMLREGKNFLNLHAKKILYYAQIYSHLSYGIITWGNMIDNMKLVKLNKLHEKCIKLVGLPLLRFREILKLQNLKLGHKIKNPQSRLPIKIKKACTTDVWNKSLCKGHQYNTRNKEIPNLPKGNCPLYRPSFLVQSIKDYSSVPVELKSVENESLFLSSCKRFLFSSLTTDR